ncbi:MAG: glycine cleavage system aminomethyltransferase GcvT [Acetobacteraceae bacterium]|nr:glycine cleavage system aminomethyltransferase GcvT [Acetobacteraceae bacterium]
MRPTPLDALHRSMGARMVPFAGYAMPLHYKAGIIAEHLHCRSQAALFDISHMGQATLAGPMAAAYLETLVPSDIIGLKPGRQRYTVFTNEAGGILDDLIVTHLPGDQFHLVVNASRKEADYHHLQTNLPGALTLDPLDDRALLALQGPQASAVMRRLVSDAASLPFMAAAAVQIVGIGCLVARSGYTGEDGFEISVPAGSAEMLARLLLDQPEVALAGLGARDTLRLEAGLCLYGNDIDELTTPVEAGLAWIIGKRRRATWDFPGGLAIRDEAEHGPHRRRVGIRPEGRAPVRAGALMVAMDGTGAGTVTSGGFSPTLNAPIAMGYVRRDLTAPGTRIAIQVRRKVVAAEVVALPFVAHRYAR